MRTVYAIQDTTGATIAEHVRVDLPTGKRMYWQVPGCDPRDGLMGLSTPDLPLYGSQYIPLWDVGATVVVCEGERAADVVFASGRPALATVTGASATPGEDALAPLLPFDVVTWEDHDEPGAAHMQRVAERLIRLGGRARRLIWGRDKGDDAVDFLGEGTLDALNLLIRSAQPWGIEPAPQPRPIRPSYDRAEGEERVRTARSHLLDVVQEKLGPHRKRMGRSLFWPCPFHSEKSPSFKVDLHEPFYVCFGCGARGDVFTFLRAIEGVAFKDALRELAPPRLLGAAIPW